MWYLPYPAHSACSRCSSPQVKGKRVTATEVDITFARVGHGGRKITYAQFMEAMQHLATMRYPSAESPDGGYHLAVAPHICTRAGVPLTYSCW